ncbi:3',5'-cyclic-AMP phosphodiesterase 4C-like isoform X3 [Watersipora subatra]|uniref:3',5'-cyclic-AMP phosphodiesterase 4C-like isoform X3 n=1 Tax=Watersipora subatra TaxID=2589382 RepID=UPI00355BE79D
MSGEERLDCNGDCDCAAHSLHLHIPTFVVSNSFDGDDRGYADGASPASSLYLSSMGQHRRESFLYRSDSEYDISNKSISRHSSLASETCIDATTLGRLQKVSQLSTGNTTRHEDVIVTPFAQILQTLRTVRSNFINITKITNAKGSRGSTTPQPSNSLANNMKHTMAEDENQQIARTTLEELDWCLDQLETMHTHRSVGDLASTKFRKMLGKELSAFEAASNNVGATGNSRVSEFIINTYLDKEQELELPYPEGSGGGKSAPQAASSSEYIQTEAIQPKISHKVLSKTSSASCIPECPEDIPVSGVTTPSEPELMQHLEKVDDWGIDVFKIAQLSNDRPLTCIAYTIMKKRNLLNLFQINPQTLVTYLMHLEAHYHTDVPYHNNMHAADVVQSAHVLLNAQVLKPIFNDLEVLATLFACAAHDVDHPGVSNQFLVVTEAELAYLYNDESVLENHHIALGFQLLKDEGCNVFSQLTPKQWKTVRKMAIDMVLATDMSKHMGLLADLKTMVETKKVAAAYELKLDNYAERIQVLQNLVHCADLSNPTKPRNYYNQWTTRITEEFFRQGDKEKKLDIAISPMCERPNSDMEYNECVAKTQVGFITYIVHPLWETWGDLVSNAEVQLAHLEENRDYYNRVYQECLEKRDATSAADESEGAASAKSK